MASSTPRTTPAPSSKPNLDNFSRLPESHNGTLVTVTPKVFKYNSRTSVAIGPLTTTFIPPADCTSLDWFTAVLDGGPQYSEKVTLTQIWNQYPNRYNLTSWGSCYPTGFTELAGSWYSPGVCPQSWVSILRTPVGQRSADEESTAICCPPNFRYQKTAETAAETNVGICMSVIVDATEGSSHGVSTTVLMPIFRGDAMAMAVEVRWRSSDKVKPIFGTSEPQQSSSKSFSAGTVIILAVTIPIFVLVTMLVSVCVLLRYRKRRIKAVQELKKEGLVDPQAEDKGSTHREDKVELDGEGIEMTELPAHEVLEAPTESDKVELATMSFKEPVELEGSPVAEMAANKIKGRRSTEKVP
jgi:hypothetical protein